MVCRRGDETTLAVAATAAFVMAFAMAMASFVAFAAVAAAFMVSFVVAFVLAAFMTATFVSGMGLMIGIASEKPAGEVVGIAVALSTVSNIRGMSTEDFDVVVFDEFIPERHERPIRAEDTAFLNCLETFNRNREVQNKPPLKVILLSNSNDLDSPILDAIGALRPLDEMIRKRQSYRQIHNGAVSIYRYIDSPISDRKRNTVLYRISNNDDFSSMALSNEFSKANYENVERRDLKQYRPLVSIGGMTVYEHKSERQYYVVDGVKCEVSYTLYPNSIKAFMRKYWYIKEAMLLEKIKYTSAPVKIAFEKIWKVI